MEESIADVLVVLLPSGASLARWRRAGQLGRQLPLLRRLAERHGRLVVASFGGPEDRIVAREVDLPGDLVCDPNPNDAQSWARRMPGEIARIATPARTAIVRTTQLNTAHVGVATCAALKHAGVRTALIARGSAIPSRYLGRDLSFDHPRVRQATADEALLVSAADLVSAPTGKLADDLAWRFALPAERVCVIPTHVGAVAGVPDPADRDEATLLFAGQLVARKRVDLLIRAAAELRDVHETPAHVRIIGDGPEFEALHKLASDMDVNATIHQSVAHDELIEAMRRCTVYVQASEYETHPESVLEAMALGCAVVVADAPGLASIVNHPVAGMRVPPTPTDFARAIAGLLADAELRQMIGANAAQSVREHCSVDAILPLELGAHRQAMANAAARLRAAA